MKKLYNCSATYTAAVDDKRLTSYATEIAYQDKEIYALWYYPSNTSKQHLRKFIKKLRELGYHISANIFSDLYDFCKRTGSTAVAYNSHTGDCATGKAAFIQAGLGLILK